MNRLLMKLLALLLVPGLIPAQAATPAHDMQKMWQDILARPALAVAAVFDERGGLWRAQVSDGFLWVAREGGGAAVRVNREPERIAAEGENRPKLLVRGNVIYVSYTLSREKPMTGDIRFSRSLDGGRSFSAPLTVNDNQEEISHRFDSLAVNKRGQVFLAWLDKRDQSAARQAGGDYAGAALYYAVSDDGGATFRRNIKLADHTCECCRTAMALDKDGVPVVAWRHIYDGNIRDHALARLDGSPMRRLGNENWQVAACPHHGPALSIGDDGIYHAAWFSNAAGRRGLFYAYSGDRGLNFSAPLNFGQAAVQAAHPALLSLGQNVYLAWKEFDGEHTHIALMRSGDGGKNWGTPRRLADTADASDHPQLLAKQQRVYLSWFSLKEGHRLIEVAE